MTQAEQLRSGKGHRDENFPVARLVQPKHRPAILAFYNYVRTADDIADHASLSESEKLALLDKLEANLLGQASDQPVAVALRAVLAERGLSPRHAQDLVTAFRMDVTKRRYKDWEDLIHYCSYSAMPVGRYVLDVHGEDRAIWPANDALCAALQIINHLQDCGKDYRELDRVYVPLDAFAAAGAGVEELGASRASKNLLHCLHHVAARTRPLLANSNVFSRQIADWRLAIEVSLIQTYAERILALLLARDPLSENVHLSKAQFAGHGLAGLTAGLLGRLRRSVSLSQNLSGAR
jgi:hydroxysqualene synthase